MRAIKSLLVMTAVAGLVATMGARSFAGPLLPSFELNWWLTNPVKAGQSQLVNPSNPAGDYINVDWLVIYDEAGVWGHPGSFVYLYQLENTAGSSSIRAFNVTYYNPFFSNEVGIKAGDLDDNTALWTGHNSGNFGNLGSPPTPAETEPGGGPQGVPDNYDALQLPGSVSFTTVGIGITQESLVLYIIDPRPPVYGEARAQDGATWWGKVTVGPITYGDPVPVPSPEPTTIVLLAMGVIGTVALRNRRR